MERSSSPPPQTASPTPVARDGGEGVADHPNELILPRIPIAAVEDKIADSCAESSLGSLSSSVASSPAAWDPQKLSLAIATRRREALPTQDPAEPSPKPVAIEKHDSRTKCLHAALAPVGDDADADLQAKRQKLVRTLQDAEEDGLTNWYTQSIIYREMIEDPHTLREILDQTLEKGTSYLSRAEIESITAEVQTPPRSPSVPSEPDEAPRPSAAWTPINRKEPEEEEDDDSGDGDDEDGSRDAARGADDAVPSDEYDAGIKDADADGDEDEEADADARGAAVLLPEVGDCFRARTYGGGHPGTTWAALVQPLMHEDYLANMRTGKQVMALRRAREKEMATRAASTSTNTTATTASTPTTAASSSKKRKKPPPRTPSPGARKHHKRQRRERKAEEEEEEATPSPTSGKTGETGDGFVVVSPSSDTSADDQVVPAPPP